MSNHHPSGRAVALSLTAVMLAALLPVQAFAASGPAPAFTLDLFDGKTLSLADYKGSPVILLFWAPW